MKEAYAKYELRELDSCRRALPTESHPTFAEALSSAQLGIDFGNTKEVIVEIETGEVLYYWEA